MSDRAPEVGPSEGANPAQSPSLDSDQPRATTPGAPDGADPSQPFTPNDDPTRPVALNNDPIRPVTPNDDPAFPTYKGAPLDAERGPGLGCFWIQVVLLVAMLILTPVSVWVTAPPWVSAALLLISLGLLFFVGQTSIFLLRLVAADRRAQRRPLREGARPTVGQLSRDADRKRDADSNEDDTGTV